jgi:DNA-binding transcriptional LysR family regulator
LPGLLHGHRRQHPEVKTTVSHLAGSALIEAVASCHLDLGILCPPARLPESVEVTHRITDRFSILAPRDLAVPTEIHESRTWAAWVAEQSWIVPPARTRSRACIDAWWATQGLAPTAAMELDSFDMAIHLVALGLGVACVPRRAFSGFARKGRLQKVPLPLPLARELVVITPRRTSTTAATTKAAASTAELVVITPRRTSTPEHVREFVRSILF